MPRDGTRFAYSDRADLYRSMVELTRLEPMTGPQITTIVGHRFPKPPTYSTVAKHLAHWSKAGAFVKVAGGGNTHGVWQATPRAMTRPMVLACLGKYAGPILAELEEVNGQAERVFEANARHSANGSESNGRAKAEAIEVSDPDLAWGRAILREPLPPEPEPPSYYFDATFTPDGVVISYDEFFRVAALLKRISQGAN